ncbi:MAG TPA: hypothetical protein VHC20_05820, partial [Candidatus Paceibacterota bacterium]|nr:hypothetical protein [Candidatus Paceibacterota bacterium]
MMYLRKGHDSDWNHGLSALEYFLAVAVSVLHPNGACCLMPGGTETQEVDARGKRACIEHGLV